MKSKTVNIEPCLYIVATPIGNLGDITLRALEVLKAVDVIACEDTRITAKLLSHYGISAKTISCHDHNENEVKEKISGLILSGKSVAFVSDAGTPLISDPGYMLVKHCRELGCKITSIPGASSILTALTLSSMPSDCFMFLGFLPVSKKARNEVLEPILNIKASLIILSTGPKLIDDLKTINKELGKRQVALARELTKIYEEVINLPIEELIDLYEEKPLPKGEIVLVVSGSKQKEIGVAELDELLIKRLKTLSVKAAVEEVSNLARIPKNKVYARALELKNA